MSPMRNEQAAEKNAIKASAKATTLPEDNARPATGAIRRNRKQNKQQNVSGRSHEENQERYDTFPSISDVLAADTL